MYLLTCRVDTHASVQIYSIYGLSHAACPIRRPGPHKMPMYILLRHISTLLLPLDARSMVVSSRRCLSDACDASQPSRCARQARHVAPGAASSASQPPPPPPPSPTTKSCSTTSNNHGPSQPCRVRPLRPQPAGRVPPPRLSSGIQPASQEETGPPGPPVRMVGPSQGAHTVG